MSSMLSKVKPRPRNPKCKCCIAKQLRDEKREAKRHGGHVL